MTTTTTEPWEREYPDAGAVEAQRAYVEARRHGYGFTAHQDAWHWYDPNEDAAYSRRRDPYRGLALMVIVTEHAGPVNWIEAAVRTTKRAPL